MIPVFALTQVSDTCFTEQEVLDISFILDSLYIADSINNKLINEQLVLIDQQKHLIHLDSLELEYKSKQIDLLNNNIAIYVDREKKLQPKWYDNKMIYFSGGIITAILTSKLIIEVIK
jgi:hypothetical protein